MDECTGRVWHLAISAVSTRTWVILSFTLCVRFSFHRLQFQSRNVRVPTWLGIGSSAYTSPVIIQIHFFSPVHARDMEQSWKIIKTSVSLSSLKVQLVRWNESEVVCSSWWVINSFFNAPFEVCSLALGLHGNLMNFSRSRRQLFQVCSSTAEGSCSRASHSQAGTCRPVGLI
jgi:hypothetical protein